MLEGFGLSRKRSRRLLALNCSEDRLEIVYVERARSTFRLLAYDVKRILPEEEGREDSEKTTVDFINGFRKKNSVSAKDIVISISDPDSVAAKCVSLPDLPEEEICDAAKWQLKEEVQFDLENAVFDWRLLKEYTDAEGVQKKDIIFTACQREVIDSYISIIDECGLNPVSILSNSFSYSTLLSYTPANPPISAVLNIDYKDSTIGVYTDNKLCFVRRLPVSGEKLTRSLTGILVSEQGKIELSLEEAEEIKNTVGVPQDEEAVIKDNIHASHILSLIRPFLELLVRELRFSFDHFTSHFNREGPVALYITGGGANIKNLEWYLNKELGINVSYLPMPACVDTRELKQDKLDSYSQNTIMNAVAAALSGSQSVNLLPLEIQAQKTMLIQKASLRLVTVTMSAIFILLFFMTQFQIRDYKNRLKNAQRHLGTIAQVKVLQQKMQQKTGLVEKIQKARVPADGLLKTISNLVPPEIILDQMLFDQRSNSLTLKGTALAGEDTARATLTDFMQELEESSFFTEATFVSSQKEGALERFDILCDIVKQ